MYDEFGLQRLNPTYSNLHGHTESHIGFNKDMTLGFWSIVCDGGGQNITNQPLG